MLERVAVAAVVVVVVVAAVVGVAVDGDAVAESFAVVYEASGTDVAAWCWRLLDC